MIETVARRLSAVEQRIESACSRSGRSRSAVTLVAVSKTFSASDIEEAIAAGVTDIGENKVQEAESKLASLERVARFHLIGHLQSNKSKLAVSLFDVVQTVDSSKLGRRLNDAAAAEGKQLEVLVQVNVGEEEQKHGVRAADAPALIAELQPFENLEVTGLMTIPPVGGEAETREYFGNLRALRDRIRDDLGLTPFRHLSMGMSADYEIAIEEGATIVRVGSAIFGRRG
ncbi:MAG: YggS family pyridoxal phosphate-dependent enzyme [Acidobacteria bacterium]|nr:YggS family pyridoxal phosphate-dependent enzyme [Acidobacteriota bacterium]